MAACRSSNRVSSYTSYTAMGARLDEVRECMEELTGYSTPNRGVGISAGRTAEGDALSNAAIAARLERVEDQLLVARRFQTEELSERLESLERALAEGIGQCSTGGDDLQHMREELLRRQVDATGVRADIELRLAALEQQVAGSPRGAHSDLAALVRKQVALALAEAERTIIVKSERHVKKLAEECMDELMPDLKSLEKQKNLTSHCDSASISECLRRVNDIEGKFGCYLQSTGEFAEAQHETLEGLRRDVDDLSYRLGKPGPSPRFGVDHDAPSSAQSCCRSQGAGVESLQRPRGRASDSAAVAAAPHAAPPGGSQPMQQGAGKPNAGPHMLPSKSVSSVRPQVSATAAAVISKEQAGTQPQGQLLCDGVDAGKPVTAPQSRAPSRSASPVRPHPSAATGTVASRDQTGMLSASGSTCLLGRIVAGSPPRDQHAASKMDANNNSSLGSDSCHRSPQPQDGHASPATPPRVAKQHSGGRQSMPARVGKVTGPPPPQRSVQASPQRSQHACSTLQVSPQRGSGAPSSLPQRMQPSPALRAQHLAPQRSR